MNIDLHIHSTESDGTLTPDRIVRRAKQLGITAISITDHDTVSGVRTALPLAKTEVLGYVSGVEVSAGPPSPFSISGSLHMLGYGMDPDHPDLVEMLDRLSRARRERFPKMIEKLNRLHIDVTHEAVLALAGSTPVARPHIAQAMVAMGAVRSVDEAFARYLANGRPAYVDRYRVPIEEVLATVSAAGGVCVLAHPGLVHMADGERIEDLVMRLVHMGVRGIEAHYPEHSPAQTRFFITLAEAYGLIVTGGTDFHGAVRPEIEMGMGRGDFAVPSAIWDQLATLPLDGRFFVPPANGSHP